MDRSRTTVLRPEHNVVQRTVTVVTQGDIKCGAMHATETITVHVDGAMSEGSHAKRDSHMTLGCELQSNWFAFQAVPLFVSGTAAPVLDDITK